MAGKRIIRIRWLKPGTPRALALDAAPDSIITYDGGAQSVRMR
jgi:hypothetical protein